MHTLFHRDGDIVKKKGLFCLLTAVGLVVLLAQADQVRDSLSEALELCVRTVIPSQFLFLVMSSLLVSLGFGELLAPRLEGLMYPLFQVDGAGASALILGLVGGYPIGARTAAELYKAGQVSKSEAERLLAFTNNANPAFLISVLGVGVFGSVRTGVWLWLIHVLSALITGIAFRNYGSSSQSSHRRHPAAALTVPFPNAFVEAVRGALWTVLNICAFVAVFYVLARPLKAMGGLPATLSVGFLELFSVTPLIPNSCIGFCLAAGLAGWGGLSVLCQTLAILSDSGLSSRSCALGKVVQAGISVLLALLLSGYVLG